MAEPPSREVLNRIRKLVLLPEEVKQSRWAVSSTRLTTLKSLCQDPEVANRFVTYLARKIVERVEAGQGRSHQSNKAREALHRQMMAEALVGMEAWARDPSDERRRALWDLLIRLQAEQNEHQRIQWGSVRLITDQDLLLVEYALRCVLGSANEAPFWAYQTARHYAERYNSSEGTGLISSSVRLLQDIADFWVQEFGLDPAELTAPARPKKPKAEKPATRTRTSPPREQEKARFTPRQGQFLAFIHLYTRMHKQAPAETDMMRFFRVTPPAVHGMILKLEELGLITRQPGVPRSVRVVVPEKDLPPLEEIPGPPW
jgi:hypothetical protein